MAGKQKTAEELEDGLLKKIRDEHEYNFTKWEPIYKEGDIDMRYRAGDPWDPADKLARDQANRPALSFDELSQYRNQAVNDVRANPVEGKFTPVGDGANDDTARFYEDFSREIDYRSNATEAFTTAFENAIDRSFGYVRLKTEFEHPKSFRQQLTIESIPNPAAFFPDFDAQSPTGKDWRNADFIEKYTRDEFKRTFKDAKFQDFSREQIQSLGTGGGRWGAEDSVQVTEHWDVQLQEKKLIQYFVPATAMRPERFIDVLEGERKPRNGVLVQERVTEVPIVTSCFTNGLELLEKGGKKVHAFAGDFIPFAACYGAILYRDKTESGKGASGAEREILSMIRLARSPYMAYCYAITALVEAIGMITKNPYFAYEGMLNAEQMNAIAKSLHEPVAVLLSKPFLADAKELGLLPMLQRNPLAVDISSYLGLAELCRRAIQAAMGWTPLPTQMQQDDKKLSGKAMDKLQDSGQRGSFHFKDHYYGMIRRVTEQKEALIDKIHDTKQEVVTRAKDNEVQRWQINDPKAKPGERVLPSVKGRHSVTINIGPKEQSEREAADKFVENFVTSPLMGMIEPGKRDKLISLAIKSVNIGPMGDKMADVISPPENETGEQDPQQLIAALKQGEQIMQQMQARIKELESGMAVKQLEVQSREKIAAASEATKRDIASLTTGQKSEDSERDSVTAITIQKMKMQIDQMQMVLDAQIAKMDKVHDRAMAERGADLGEAAAGRDHERGIESQSQAEEAAERQAKAKSKPNGAGE